MHIPMIKPIASPDAEAELTEDRALVLPADAATSRINISGDTVTKATAELGEEQKVLVRWAFNFAKENDLSWKDAGRTFKVSTTTLYRIWTDKYRQPDLIRGEKLPNGTFQKVQNPRAGERVSLDNVCTELLRAKRLADARAGVGRLPFIHTKTYDRFAKIADEVLATNTIGFILGESQVGKTRCAEEYQRRNNHGQTVLVTCPPAAGVQLLTSEIGRALHIGRSSFDKTYLRVCEALDDSRLLILDEAHMLFETYQKTSVARCLATIRHIHDRSKCGLLIIATNTFATSAKESEFRNTMKQFFRRGTLTLNLGTEPEWDDVLKICAHYKLGEPHGAVKETLELLAHEDGLGKITKYLHGAARSAAKKEQRLAWHHFTNYVEITDKMANGLSLREGK